MIAKWNYLIFTTCLLFIVPQYSDEANILAFLPSYSFSHLIIQMAAVKAMAERQHNVTVVSVLPLKSDLLHPNMTVIQLDKGKIDTDHAINIRKRNGMKKFGESYRIVKSLLYNMSLIMEDQKFQELLNNPGNKFDLMMHGYMLGDYFHGIAEHFDCAVALIWPNKLNAHILNLVGSPLEMSYTVLTVVNTVSKNTEGFLFRLKNIILITTEIILFKVLETESRNIYKEYFPPDKYASYDKAKQRVSMVLFSNHFTEKPIRPLVPALIEIGGIHINDQPKALPQDMADFISSGKHGFIFFSMGTNIKERHMQPHTLEKIFNVLSRLPQKVIWKVDDESRVPGNASNIFYRKWLPQSDILGHSNIKLFIGHGGKGGITEAKFYGVPMVGLPIFGDQPMNMEEIVRKGYGLSIDHDKPLSEEIISNTILEVLENPFYANNVRRFSMLYRDRPLKAKDNAVYWLEYLIRYKGAPHMQSPLKTMSFMEAMNLDIITFILIVLLIVVKLIKTLTSAVITSIRKLVKTKIKPD